MPAEAHVGSSSAASRSAAGARVDVWSLPLVYSPADEDALSLALSPEETARLHRISLEERRRRTRVAWASRRILLARCLGCAPRDVPLLRRADGGLPPAMPGSGLHFSLSHSGDVMLFAVSNAAPVGVDVERIDSDVDVLRLARRFFTDREAAALATLPPRAARARFFALWTRKEAILKGLGGGVPSRLRTVEIERAAGRGTVRAGGKDWSLFDVPAPGGYAAALAVQGKGMIRAHRGLGEFSPSSRERPV